jgi:excisionase family DNA binding protein
LPYLDLAPVNACSFAGESPFSQLASITNFDKVGRFGYLSEPGSHESGSDEVEKLSDYLRISEAAEYLGVSPNTLRNWVNADKIAAVRHPVNDYRLFKREDLDALLKQLQQASAKKRKR